MASCSAKDCRSKAEWRRKADGAWVCDIHATRPERVGPHDYDEDPGADDSLYDHVDGCAECDACGEWFPEETVKPASDAADCNESHRVCEKCMDDPCPVCAQEEEADADRAWTSSYWAGGGPWR